ncbi:unnamed protein product [Ceutorhynchus assimilis]|uniref:NOF-FB transposable element protein n=1 Tax=Ceutorhynchus assimilis TaxID=467358 RepID=A0A9N9MJ85_9CUCU|nr:unnamed protein product [Ceutorhynchus assimilis]
MPQNRKIDHLFDIFLKNKSEIFDIVTGKINPPSHSVWKIISKEASHHYTKKYLYTMVLQNRHNFLEKLKPSLKDVPQHDELSSSDENSTNSKNSISTEENSTSFCITLSAQEWNEIKPQSKLYGSRIYNALPPGKWTSIVANHFWHVTKLPCTIKFHRAKIHETGLYLNFKGTCKNCESNLTGVLPVKPSAHSLVVIHCQYSGNFDDCKSVIKRQLRGAYRREIGKVLLSNRLPASTYRKRQVDNIMILGEAEPNVIPKSNILRNLKYEERKRNRLSEDPIESVYALKYQHPYNNYIKDIGLDRLFVHYWSTPQIHVYNNYVQTTTHSKISIDATGEVVRRITKPSGEKSKVIFLYDITVNDRKTGMQYSACNMLSERHDADSIMHWLQFWKRDGAKMPNEVVCDMSIALTSAIIRSFTSYSSLGVYLDDCYEHLLKRQSLKFKLSTYVRFDVAHVIKSICGWECLKSAPKRSRHFYKRVIGQLIQTTNMSDAHKILKAICVVALNETEGTSGSTNIETPSEKCKSFLRRVIGYENMNDDIGNEYETDNDIMNFEDLSNNNFCEWGRAIETEARNEIVRGNRDNCQFLPALIPKIISLLKTFPLWSSVMSTEHFPNAHSTASSAPVESNFNNLKNRTFADEHLPIRIDEFLTKHISSLEGAMKIAMAQSLDNTFETVETAKDESLHNISSIQQSPTEVLSDLFLTAPADYDIADEEIRAQENWGGLVVPSKRKRRSYLEKNSEWLHIDLQQKVSVVPIGILRNGNCVKLQPVKLAKKKVLLTNTCAFDSLMQILCTSFCDSNHFAAFFQSQQLLELTKQMIKLIGLKAYKLRAEILSMTFPNHNMLPNGMIHISTETTVENLIRKLANSGELYYSYVEKIYCSKCSNIRIISMPIIPLVIEQNISISEGVESYFWKRFSSSTCSRKDCGGTTDVSIEKNQVYIFVEITRSTTNSLPSIRLLRLSDISKEIWIDDTLLTLGGVIAYVGPQQPINITHIGHFKAYCHRIGEKWELYDSLANNKQDCSEVEMVYPHLLFYRV